VLDGRKMVLICVCAFFSTMPSGIVSLMHQTQMQLTFCKIFVLFFLICFFLHFGATTDLTHASDRLNNQSSSRRTNDNELGITFFFCGFTFINPGQ
jgi:hypothetical protein